MTEYKILFASFTSDLESQVKRHLQMGYKLAGGITADKDGYLQAVYKEK